MNITTKLIDEAYESLSVEASDVDKDLMSNIINSKAFIALYQNCVSYYSTKLDIGRFIYLLVGASMQEGICIGVKISEAQRIRNKICALVT